MLKKISRKYRCHTALLALASVAVIQDVSAMVEELDIPRMVIASQKTTGNDVAPPKEEDGGAPFPADVAHTAPPGEFGESNTGEEARSQTTQNNEQSDEAKPATNGSRKVRFHRVGFIQPSTDPRIGRVLSIGAKKGDAITLMGRSDDGTVKVSTMLSLPPGSIFAGLDPEKGTVSVYVPKSTAASGTESVATAPASASAVEENDSEVDDSEVATSVLRSLRLGKKPGEKKNLSQTTTTGFFNWLFGRGTGTTADNTTPPPAPGNGPTVFSPRSVAATQGVAPAQAVHDEDPDSERGKQSNPQKIARAHLVRFVLAGGLLGTTQEETKAADAAPDAAQLSADAPNRESTAPAGISSDTSSDAGSVTTAPAQTPLPSPDSDALAAEDFGVSDSKSLPTDQLPINTEVSEGGYGWFSSSSLRWLLGYGATSQSNNG